ARGGAQLADDRPTPLSVSELLESVCDIVRPIAAEKGLTVGVTLPTIDLRLGHALALRRVLLNLTTNALKFTERGSVDIVAVEQPPRGSGSPCATRARASIPKRWRACFTRSGAAPRRVDTSSRARASDWRSRGAWCGPWARSCASRRTPTWVRSSGSTWSSRLLQVGQRVDRD